MPQENASMAVNCKKQHFDNMLEQFVNYYVFRLWVTVNDKVYNDGFYLIGRFVVLMQLNDSAQG